jgi:putative OPT family oligopeptide transporter
MAENQAGEQAPAAVRPPAIEAATGMPENAHRELQPGEVYVPLVVDEKPKHEVTTRSVVFGIANALFWSAAVSYLTLKLGQGLEAAIPIAILAIGFSALFRRRSTHLENVNILAFGATSGIVVGGSLFVMPAIFILNLQDRSDFFQIFFVPLLGAALGVLFLIPLRRYFVREMHGKLPFPEGTAIAEVLVTGQRGGRQAWVLLKAMGVGFAFDALTTLLKVWPENFTTASLSFLEKFNEKFKAIFALNTTAAIAGLGYLIGVRYAAFIMAGSMFSYYIIIPLLAFIGSQGTVTLGAGLPPLGKMSHDELFLEYARYIGIGAIVMAGIISIIRMFPVMIQAIGQGLRGIREAREGRAQKQQRSDQDIPMPVVLALMGVVLLAAFVYFRVAVTANQESPTLMAALAVLIAFGISLLFSAVSAWAVATISVTPISGMTLMTLILSAVLLRELGFEGEEGKLGVLLIGGVVCTCLSMTGTLVTEFKVSYWLGATPRRVQWSNLAGSLVSAVAVTAVMLLLAQVYGFEKSALHPEPLPAPQAGAMAKIMDFLMGTGDASKWVLLALGAGVALIVEMIGVSALAFALGMYIPMEYNSPILAGAIVAHFVRRSSKDATLNRARGDRGILISSGLIAGGALAGVMAALVQFFESSLGVELWRVNAQGDLAAFLGLLMFLGICGYMFWDSCRARREEVGPKLEV